MAKKDNEDRITKKERKAKKFRKSTCTVLLLFFVFLLMLLNIDMFTYDLNSESYEPAVATVKTVTTDDYFMLIPMIRLKYMSGGFAYEEKIPFYIEPLFGMSAKEGDELMIYVNKQAPENLIVKKYFYKNIINWILLFFILIALYSIIKQIVISVKTRKKERG